MTTIPIPTSIPRAPAIRALLDCRGQNSKFFHLDHDGAQADVIILYPSIKDALAFNVKVFKDSGVKRVINCPAEDREAHMHFFVPVYNITEDAIQFWDRSNLFLWQLVNLFNACPDLTKVAMRVKRHGDLHDVHTYYDIDPWYHLPKDGTMDYENLLKRFNISFPEHYMTIIENLEFTPEPKKIEIDAKIPYTALICKGCGAPIDPISKHCNFCGTTYIW